MTVESLTIMFRHNNILNDLVHNKYYCSDDKLGRFDKTDKHKDSEG